MATNMTPNAPRGRMEWVDAVKATSVILVVFMHVTQALSVVAGDTLVGGFWNSVNVFLEPLRMPIFFVVSGLLASSAVQRPWSMTKSRTIGIGYLFLLWHFLYTVYTFAVNTLVNGDTDLATTITTFFANVIVPPGGYWYLWALVVYFVIARLTRNLPVGLVLGAAALLNLARPLTVDAVRWLAEPLGAASMIDAASLNLVYFLAGVHGVALLRRISIENDPRLLQLSGTAAITGSIIRVMEPGLRGLSFLPLAAAWIVFGVLVAVRLSAYEPVRQFGSFVGARTLPIFVLQFPLIFLLYKGLGSYGAFVAGNPFAQALFPIVFTALFTGIALVVYAAAMKGRARLLFAAPPAWTARPMVVAPDTADAAAPADRPTTVVVSVPAERR